MGACLEKLPHSCGTRNGLQVFARDDGTVDGFCFSCKKYVRHPYGKERNAKELPKPKEKTQEEIDIELAEILGLPSVDVPQKKLRAAFLEHFGIKVALSEEDGKTPEMLCYPYTSKGKIVAYKIKILKDKRIWAIGSLKDCDPFGWEQAVAMGAKRLIVTEGEDDAVAWTRILEMMQKEGFKDFTAVVSLINGASSAKTFFTKFGKKIKEHFNEVYVSFDMDDPGRKAVEDACLVFPEVRDIKLPSKDANQCIIEGKIKAAFNSLFKAVKPKTSRLVFGEDLHEAAKEPAKYGDLTWPWEHINKATRGIRYGETIYIGAGVKMGKSELVNALAAHLIKEHGVKIFMAKPEEVNKKTYKLLAGKVVGRIFHDPEIEFDEEAYDQAGEILNDKVAMVDLYQHMGWGSLKDDIIASIAWGAKAIFIDPITNLTSGMAAADANTKLEEIAEELSVIAKDHEVVIFIFCHLKAPEGMVSKDARAKAYREGKYIGLGNCPHELGGDIYSAQFAGSRSMMRKCNMMIGFEGNKDPELAQEIRNVRHLKILEDREFGVNGVYPIYWNNNTSLFKEC